MNQVLKKETCFLEQNLDLEKISKKTGIPLWEIEYAAKEFTNHCQLNSIPEANSAYESSPLNSRSRFEVKLKLDDLCFKAIEKAENFDDVLSVFKFTSHESRSYKEALKKMLRLADNESKLKCLIEKCPDIISEIRVGAVQKIIMLHNKDKEC